MKKHLFIIIAGVLAMLMVGFTFWYISTSPYYNSVFDSFSGKCGLESCHGLDITCGNKVPATCDELYQLGDFCRDFVQCEKQEGSCVAVENEQFNQCKLCVTECINIQDTLSAFECEARCQRRFNK